MSLLFQFVDVAFDGWYGYTYMRSDTVIDPLITRQIGVAVSLWMLCTFGFFLIPFQLTFLLREIFFSINIRGPEFDNPISVIIRWSVLNGLGNFEDVVELFIEYLYVDLYVIESPPNFTIARDILSGIIQLWSLASYGMSLIPKLTNISRRDKNTRNFYLYPNLEQFLSFFSLFVVRCLGSNTFDSNIPDRINLCIEKEWDY